jgi:radical SAM protein with 4Fe4S-binding SPASM domain
LGADSVVRAALSAEVNRVYQRFHFRKPAPHEIVRHLAHFGQKFPAAADQYQALRAGAVVRHLGIRPLTLETDLTNQCKLRCTFCYMSLDHYSRQRRDDISLEDFVRIAEQVFPLCHTVNLARIAEPLLHRQFGELLAITGRYGVPCIGITTNALLLDERRIEEAVTGGLNHAVVSIDGPTPATYERLRRKGHFDRLLANLRALNRSKERHGSRTADLAFSFVMMRSNIRELSAIVRLADQLQVLVVIANHLTPLAGLGTESEVMSKDPDLCNRMMDEARDLAGRYGIEIRLPGRFEPAGDGGSLLRIGVSALAGKTSTVDPSVREAGRRRERSFFGLALGGDEARDHCLYPWHYVIVTRYGDVLPCGGWWEQPFGNLFRDSFEEIWNNARYQALRSEHCGGALGPTCRACPATMMGNVNSEGAFLTRKV